MYLHRSEHISTLPKKEIYFDSYVFMCQLNQRCEQRKTEERNKRRKYRDLSKRNEVKC